MRLLPCLLPLRGVLTAETLFNGRNLRRLGGGFCFEDLEIARFP